MLTMESSQTNPPEEELGLPGLRFLQHHPHLQVQQKSPRGTLWDKETFGVRAAVLQVTHCNQPATRRPLWGSSLIRMHKYLQVAILSRGGTKGANLGEQVTPG